MQIDERAFTDIIMKHGIKDDPPFKRALAVFRNYGTALALDVTNVLLHAYQHPDIRGRVTDSLLRINPTEAMFLQLCEVTLGLKPAEPFGPAEGRNVAGHGD